MKVDFNNVRRQACYSYDKLCVKLNNAIKDKPSHSMIVIDPEDIREDMEDLRMLIGTIAMSYLEGDDEVKDVYPTDRKMEEFYPEEETV